MNFAEMIMRQFILFLTITGVAAESLAQGLPDELLRDLPKAPYTEEQLTARLLRNLERLKDEADLIPLLGRAGAVLGQRPRLREALREHVAKAAAEVNESQFYALAPAVAHYPKLRDKYLQRIEDVRMRGYVLNHYARQVEPFEVAKAYCDQIQDKTRRHFVLEVLVQRAPTLDAKLQVIKESTSLAEPQQQSYSSLYTLHGQAADESKKLLDFLRAETPAETAAMICLHYAHHAAKTNRDTAAQYMDYAWSVVDQTQRPHDVAAMLLERDFREVSRTTWMEKFDKFILPSLVAGKTSIGPLAQLVRFDMEVLIDRTRKSCAHQARPFHRIFPKVVEDAFAVNPQRVLTWLEQSDPPLRDNCVLEIVEFLSLRMKPKGPATEDVVQRLTDLAVKIELPEQRLQALADIAAETHRLGVPAPDIVFHQGQKLIQALEADGQPLKIWGKGQRELFWLVDLKRQEALLTQQLDAFREADEYQQQMSFNVICDFIVDSSLKDDDKLRLLQRMQRIAADHKNTYVQARVASAAVALNPHWAVETIWSILPDDRGSSGKKTYIDWTPPPSDAQDAIRWLKRDDSAGARQQLFVALWAFLEKAPAVDKPLVRVELATWLMEEKQWEAAHTLSAQVADPLEQSYLTLQLLGAGEAPP